MARKSLWFSGARLYLLDGENIRSWFAVSGKLASSDGKVGSFKYSLASQKQKESGPLPADDYIVRIADITEYQHTMKVYAGAAAYALTEARFDVLDKLNRAWGKMPGGSGKIIPILSRDGSRKYKYGRDNCWIHGSDAPGSIGCIDLGTSMDSFVDALKSTGNDANRPIDLVVRYGVKPDGSLENCDFDKAGRSIDGVA